MSGRTLVSFSTLLSLLLLVAEPASGQSTQKVARTLPVRLNPPAPSSKTQLTPPPAIEHFVPQANPPGTEIADTVLAWDAPAKTYTAKLGELEARFTFTVTNVSPGTVTISGVSTSCGCTVAQLPSVPWILAPGVSGQINATMNLAGKIGNITKSLTVHSDKGDRTLIVHANIPTGTPRPNPGPIPLISEREANQKAAQSDRQAVFRGDCAKCHAEPAAGQTGLALYAAACGICHDSPQRAAAVPDLQHLKHPTSADYWKEWITRGKAGTMMPAFARAEGGPLSDAQVTSLIEYLTQSVTLKKTAEQ